MRFFHRHHRKYSAAGGGGGLPWDQSLLREDARESSERTNRTFSGNEYYSSDKRYLHAAPYGDHALYYSNQQGLDDISSSNAPEPARTSQIPVIIPVVVNYTSFILFNRPDGGMMTNSNALSNPNDDTEIMRFSR